MADELREALDQELATNEDGDYVVRPEYLTAIMEKTLRAAYVEGQRDGMQCTDDGLCGCDEAHGITAGVHRI